ncbi:unnamed protein product (macronuclear) [Paramecium tetraurelia]|uniref:Dynein regulatory complex protein 10 n=1 Tax=Paramecium tetraurelia TaxID=5888 RepID=A0D3U4_PARTE|nr:uncharacterized protein GSPATT00013176001 [Paramecium tetraurelia]CAK77711.1 unnamed protein product [Paramecium tetraurelia]|eukprot:XP_001445108.1 hypothetical protein (macronuclear) [Paramecium tetraurelia strain d4-2]
MSIIHNFVQQVLQFKGTYDDALLQVQSFIAQLLCSLFEVKKNQELLVFNACIKRTDQVLINLHDYFLEISPPIKSIFRDRPYNQEGFISSDDEVKQSVLPSATKPRQSNAPVVKEVILPVDEKVRMRDDLIQKMTIGYLKDVQHLREMFVRKDLFPNEEIFDASYYDYTNTLDPIIRQFIYNKILDLTQQFRLQIQNLTQQNQKYLSEIEKLKRLVKKIIGSAEIESQIKAILQIDKDLYRFWKGVQEVIGTQQIFEIFEKRKQGYGIDYVLIDRCINNSQASARIFQEFKTQLEERQIKFTEQLLREFNMQKKETDELKYYLHDQKEQKDVDILKQKTYIKSSVEQIYEIKYNTFFQDREQQRQNLQEALDLIADKDQQIWIRKCVKRHALYKWIYLAKIKKLLNQKNTRRSLSNDRSCKSTNVFGLKDNRVANLKKELKNQNEIAMEAQLNLFECQGDFQNLKSNYTNLKYNFEMQLSTRIATQQTNVQLENIVDYFGKIFNFIKNRVGLNYLEINLKNSKYFLEKADQHLKQFEQKVSSITVQDQNLIYESLKDLMKRQIVWRRVTSNCNSFTLTDVYDIKKPLQDAECELNSYMLLKNEQLKQAEYDNQIIELELEQAEKQFQQQLEKEQQKQQEDEEEEESLIVQQTDDQAQDSQNCNQKAKVPSHDPQQADFEHKYNSNKYKRRKSLIRTEQNEFHQYKSIVGQDKDRGKMKNQTQQTNVSIDCTKCYNDIFERMNPEFQQKQEEDKSQGIIQISKSKFFQTKQHTMATILTQQNVVRMQSARFKKIERHQTNHIYSQINRPQSKQERSITLKGERAQIIITPKSVPITQRQFKYTK